MTGKQSIEKRIERLFEEGMERSPPPLFLAWAEAADATDEEIATAWLRACRQSTATNSNPMAQAYVMSLDGELFGADVADDAGNGDSGEAA